tara:strand:- start:241 stop:369 length:129 start_codon:yes stop_codon:yes gene_type:complete
MFTIFTINKRIERDWIISQNEKINEITTFEEFTSIFQSICKE